MKTTRYHDFVADAGADTIREKTLVAWLDTGGYGLQKAESRAGIRGYDLSWMTGEGRDRRQVGVWLETLAEVRAYIRGHITGKGGDSRGIRLVQPHPFRGTAD